jgi:hypothetical protein
MRRSVLDSSGQNYIPTAVYYEDADSLEYVRTDEPSVYRRIDDLLTLVLSMNTREPLGFQIKGFRHFYQKHLRKQIESGDESFSKLIFVLEEALKLVGDNLFSQTNRCDAYLKARNIAEEDNVIVPTITQVA